ncbi:MAG: hypothetical protein HBSAPP03_19770 [Phycisphaerae bacterium]|nr:MAG: hypothetical protein HBSAPP03_19770 [Phycisphaerae bacterium]
MRVERSGMGFAPTRPRKAVDHFVGYLLLARAEKPAGVSFGGVGFTA